MRFVETHSSQYYDVYLPSMVRAALRVDEPELAERLAGRAGRRLPYGRHAVVAAHAAISESRGYLEAAADAYLDAADRWERFGVVPEQAFALLGRGRCLVGLGRRAEAEPVLRLAREIFERLGATPALAEIDALLATVA